MKILANGVWDDKKPDDHFFDEKLCRSILLFLKSENVKTVADLGCGDGRYAKYFNANNIETHGYDGNPHTPSITDGFGKVLDLSKPHIFRSRYDWVLSLEVGEHIPKEFETIFIDNLVNNCKFGVILSWAVLGQVGTGHVNCQNNNYVRERFQERGLKQIEELEAHFRAAAFIPWFKNTIMVFRNINTQKNLSPS